MTQHPREIGICLAFGASAPRVVRTFVGRGLRLGAIGTAIGPIWAAGATRFLGRMLYDISATDALAFASALAVVIGGVLVATLVPACRAARTNPLTGMRHQ